MSVLASCSNIITTHTIDSPEPFNQITTHDGIINEVEWNHNSFFWKSD